MLIARLIIGLFFILSGLSKLFPAEPFELYLYTTFELNWTLTTVLTRILISIEVFIGLLFCLNIINKKLLKLTFGFLVIFSLFLFYEWMYLNKEECMCLGESIKMPIHLSILKNFIFLSFIYLLLKKKSTWSFKYKRLLFLSLFLISFSAPSILSPPDFIYDSNNSLIESDLLDFNIIKNLKNKNGEIINLTEGKKVVSFFSMKCKFCKMSAKKLSVIDNRFNDEFEIAYVFWGKAENLDSFWVESESKRFPYIIMPTDTFFKFSGPSLPAIFLLDNGKVIQKLSYRSLDESDINNFIKN